MQEGDLQKLESLGVDALFQPKSLYATGGPNVWQVAEVLSQNLSKHWLDEGVGCEQETVRLHMQMQQMW